MIVSAVVPMVAILACSGCGPRRFSVEGAVFLDGEPVEGAAVTFVPTAGGRPGLSVTDAAGRFFMRDGGMANGLLPGHYDILVFKVIFGPVRSGNMPLSGPRREAGSPSDIEAFVGERVIKEYIVPHKYTTPATSGLSVTVSGTMGPLELQLSSDPS